MAVQFAVVRCPFRSASQRPRQSCERIGTSLHHDRVVRPVCPVEGVVKRGKREKLSVVEATIPSVQPIHKQPSFTQSGGGELQVRQVFIRTLPRTPLCRNPCCAPKWQAGVSDIGPREDERGAREKEGVEGGGLAPRLPCWSQDHMET